MITWQQEQWEALLQGYPGKIQADKNALRNLDAYVGDVVNETYLPRYSTREPESSYSERQNRAANNYFNFPMKILSIYANSIFRSTDPTRASEDPEIQNFWNNTDGAETFIGKFVKDRVFVLNQVAGGCLVVVDKPRLGERGSNGRPLTLADQRREGIYPYAYVEHWQALRNFKTDKSTRLEWIALEAGKDPDRQKRLYKIWDRQDWWVVDEEQTLIDGPVRHGLGIVPVIRSMALGNPKYNFQTPLTPLDEIVKISLKIFELLSMLDEMIISHIFLKIAMPKSMYEAVKAEGLGNWNIVPYPDGYEGIQAHYINTPATELETMIQLIFERYPYMILEMANIRSKVDKPREESGVAKFIDSSDELSNLIEKAENMERVEQEMTGLAALWQGIADPEYTISYSKNFDVKSANEQIAEIVTLFKEDLHSPEFAKEMVKRIQRKMLGNVDEGTWRRIEREVDAAIDPALSLADIELLIRLGILDPARIARRYNPELGSDEAAMNFVLDNLNKQRAAVEVPAFESDEAGEE